FADPARNIGAVDPYRREMYIGLGCALENLLLAADARGFAWRLALMPDRANAAHAARIDVAPAPRATSELYDAIPRRHTNRGPYDQARAVSRELLDDLARLAGADARVRWFTADAERRRLGDLIVRATEASVADDDQSRASADWFRSRWADVQRHRVRQGARGPSRRSGLGGDDDLPDRLPDAGRGAQPATGRGGCADLGVDDTPPPGPVRRRVSRSRARRCSRSGLRRRSTSRF